MKSTATQVIKRVEAAFERVTRDQAVLIWQLERVELTLRIEARRDISKALVALVKREDASQDDDHMAYEHVRVSLSAPFRALSGVRETRRSSQLAEMLELAVGLVDAMARCMGMASMTHGELQWFFVVNGSGEVILVPSENQEIYKNELHELRMYFAKSEQRPSLEIAREAKSSDSKGTINSDALLEPCRN